MSDVIYFDLETTGFPSAQALGAEAQPYITEICMMRGDEMLHELVRPPVEITEEITKITGIDNAMVAGAMSFVRLYPRIAEFCLGARTWVAHNIEFDHEVLRQELERYQLAARFPWPLELVCTYKLASQLPEDARPKKLNLGALYEYATQEQLTGAHRADVDVRALVAVHNWIKETNHG